MPNRGMYLDVVPGERLVFTNAFTSAWVPSGKPFMVGTILLADAAGVTQYDAVVGHWSEADRAQHKAMGFHQGWGIATDQLAELAGGIA